jgi:hypothetical protein
MAIGVYNALDDPRPVLRDVGVINSAEGGFEVEPNEYRAHDVSSGECREYIADSNTTSAVGTLTAEMMSDVAANLGVILMSSVSDVATGAATPETCATVVVGDVVETLFLPDANTLVVTDSDAGPSTLILGTDYEFVSKNGGMIRFLNLGAYVQPFILDYTMIDSQTVNPMSSLNDFWMISLSGGNERNSCGGEAERFYRARIAAEQTKALHVAADTKIAVPMPVTFALDRDPGRNYDFANFAVPA